MHSLYFVIFDKESAETSEEAITYARETLNQENFVSEGGYFSGAKADWFVVGGRWSGHLTKLLLDAKKLEQVYDELGEDHFWLSAEKTEDIRKKEFEKVFKKYFPNFSGVLPCWRDTYNHNGEEDDAMIITSKLAKRLKEDDKEVEAFDATNYDEATIGNFKLKDLVGKWIVVIDYHN